MALPDPYRRETPTSANVRQQAESLLDPPSPAVMELFRRHGSWAMRADLGEGLAYFCN